MAGTITHEWNGTILTITSDSGTTAMDLKGEKGDTGARGPRGIPGKAGGGARIEDGVISDETTWSSSGIIDRFAELMGTNANPAVLDNPYPNFPLQITTTFELNQSGSGEPSPSNIRPINGFNSINIVRCGKNLLKNTLETQTINGVTITNNGDGTYTLNGTATGSFTVYVDSVNKVPLSAYGIERGKQYKLIGCPAGGAEWQTYQLYLNVSGNGSNYTDIGNGIVFTPTDEDMNSTYNVGIALMQGVNCNNLVFRPMLTDDLTATYNDFVQYQGDTYTTDFGQTIYGGTLDWNTGVLTVDKGYKAFDGTEEWTKAEPDKNYFYTPMDTLEKTNDYITSIKCSTFRTANSHMYLPNNVGISGFYDIRSSYPGVNWIYINNGVSTTVAELKEWLSAQSTAGTPVQVCYKLATPQIIQLTPQEIKAIKGINTLYSNAQELTVIGRVDTMYQLSKLAERVAALEALIK